MKILTTKGEMDAESLDKRETLFEDDNERTIAVEYWLGGDQKCLHAVIEELVCLGCQAEKVHRSVTMHLKKAMVWGDGVAAEMAR